MYNYKHSTGNAKLGKAVAATYSQLELCPGACWFKQTGLCYSLRGRYRASDKYCTREFADLNEFTSTLRNTLLRLWASGDFPQSYDDSVKMLQGVHSSVTGWGYTHQGALISDDLNHVSPNVAVSWSCESVPAAILAHRDSIDTVVTVTPEFWAGRKAQYVDDTMFVRCPAEYRESVTCSSCGNGKPLCARKHRGYIVGFTMHGISTQQHNASLAERNEYRPGMIVLQTGRIEGGVA